MDVFLEVVSSGMDGGDALVPRDGTKSTVVEVVVTKQWMLSAMNGIIVEYFWER